MGKHLVAVYGTLRRNQHNHALLATATYVAMDRLPFWMMVHNGAFPYILPTVDQDDFVKVELYRVDDATLARLDVLEGVASNFYDRFKITTDLHGEAYIYAFSPQSLARRIQSREHLPVLIYGDWVSETKPMDFTVEAIMRCLDPVYRSRVLGVMAAMNMTVPAEWTGHTPRKRRKNTDEIAEAVVEPPDVNPVNPEVDEVYKFLIPEIEGDDDNANLSAPAI